MSAVQDREKAVQQPAGNASIERSAHYYRLKADVEDFYFHEADLLDDRRFREWLDILADDITYFMPIRRNVKFGQHAARENTKMGEGISWFDEDKWTLTKRVEQILTGVHYAEEPLSDLSKPRPVRDLHLRRQAKRHVAFHRDRLEGRQAGNHP